MKKKFIVCDYPNPKNYTFPPFGFGSSEKRLWYIAKTVSEFNDFEVILTGPLWLPKYIPKAKHFKQRLTPKTVDKFFKTYGKADFLLAGHEYFDKEDYINTFKKVANKIFTYILHPYKFTKNFFDRKNFFLFCYSEEIKNLYKEFRPIKQVLFHSGVDETPIFSEIHSNYLIWMGRIEEQKSPHYAIYAAKRLKMPLYVLGKPVYENEYALKYHNLLSSNYVKPFGVVFGKKKMQLISKAACAIYTVSKTFIDAGPGVLAEYLCSGIPVIGITWKGNDAICEAINSPLLGEVIKVNDKFTDWQIGELIAQSIKKCLKLDRKKIYDIANERYNMKKIMRKIFSMLLRSS